MLLIKRYIILFFCVIILSCNNNKNTYYSAQGKWTVEIAEYGNKDIKPYYYWNILELGDNGKCIFPLIDTPHRNVIPIEANGTWELIETDSIALAISIRSKNNIFNGVHRVVFDRFDDEDYFRMEIISDKLYLMCFQRLYVRGVYNENSINKLIEISHRDKETWRIKE